MKMPHAFIESKKFDIVETDALWLVGLMKKQIIGGNLNILNISR